MGKPFPDDIHAVIRGLVVDDNDLVGWDILGQNRVKAFIQVLRIVTVGYYHRDRRSHDLVADPVTASGRRLIVI